MESFIYKSAIELATLIKNKEASSTAVVQEHINRIKTYNGKLNAIVMLFEEEALQTAAQRDKELQAGDIKGPLHGVPITVKEQFWIKGKSTTINSKLFKDFIAPEDAIVIERLKNSGAVILGKTNVPALLWDYQTSGDIYPECKNPYNEAYSPGGSTGGGAAALAAGFTSLELGGDLSGSVRIPANFCGLYGLKATERTIPTYGSLPLRKPRQSFLFPMAQAGPLARNIDDLKLMWQIIKGDDPRESDIPRIEWKTTTKKDLSQYNIAWTSSWGAHTVSAPIRKTIEDFINQIKAQGSNTVYDTPSISIFSEMLRLWGGFSSYIVGQEMPWAMRKAAGLQQWLAAPKSLRKYASEATKGYQLKAKHYGKMVLLRNKITAEWGTFFQKYDFLVCPMSFGPSFKRAKKLKTITYAGETIPYGHYVWPFVAAFNASGHPAINIPLGLNDEGLPIGVQVVGPYWSEPQLLDLAKQLEPITKGFVKPKDF